MWNVKFIPPRRPPLTGRRGRLRHGLHGPEPPDSRHRKVEHPNQAEHFLTRVLPPSLASRRTRRWTAQRLMAFHQEQDLLVARTADAKRKAQPHHCVGFDLASQRLKWRWGMIELRNTNVLPRRGRLLTPWNVRCLGWTSPQFPRREEVIRSIHAYRKGTFHAWLRCFFWIAWPVQMERFHRGLVTCPARSRAQGPCEGVTMPVFEHHAPMPLLNPHSGHGTIRPRLLCASCPNRTADSVQLGSLEDGQQTRFKMRLGPLRPIGSRNTSTSRACVRPH